MEKLIKIPSKTEEVTLDWIESILEASIEPSSFQVETKVQDGFGFLSNLIRVSFIRKSIGNPERENIIVKLLSEDPTMKEVTIQEEFDKAEIMAYSSILPKLVQYMPNLSHFLCPFVYGQYPTTSTMDSVEGYQSVCVLTDLKLLGYYTKDFGDDLSQSQVEQGIDFLAKLHFSGSLLESKEGRRLDQIFPFLKTRLSKVTGPLIQIFEEGFLIAMNFLKEKSSLEVQTEYAKLGPHLGPLVIKVIQKLKECPSISHGDFWSPNLLFNDDPTKSVKIIDWQIIGYHDCTSDLAVFLSSSLPVNSLTPENVTNAVEAYYNSYLKLFNEYQLLDLHRRNWTEFSKFFNTFGLGYAVLWYMASMNVFQQKNPEKLTRLYELFYEMGVVQFLVTVKNEI